ncbi:hypothetical protein EGY25_13650 [Brevundimonas intermedia]|uniref:Uncharacterized protein n=1 Tax=Brevundimonas intermedia TaxID=74315 RepID=A0A4Y9RV37_9CAUL|nr:hypothetical protein [Brevundimonas intermedia]TFW13010.1 hypothetical protein EGY25_13650 [Brevundimonas intermedia]
MSVTSAVGVALALFGKDFIAKLVEGAAKHSFDRRLEDFKAELRKDEERLKAELRDHEKQLDSLRDGALRGLADSNARLEARRLQAIEAVWKGVVDLGPVKAISSMTGTMKMDVFLRDAAGASQNARNMQSFAEVMLKSMGPEGYKHDATPDHHRPFMSPQVWSLFSAYRILLARPTFMLMMAKFGQEPGMLAPPNELIKMLKAAMPEYVSYLDEYGEPALHNLIQPLEEKLLASIRAELNGTIGALMSVEQAKTITDHVAKIDAEARKKVGVSPLDGAK